MKDTVKEGIKGFSGNFSFGWFIVPALAVAPNKNGGTALCTGARCSAE